MVAETSVMVLRALGRQAAQRQWQRSGQCIRCFHAGLRIQASEPGKETVFNAPENGPTRQQRAAQAAEQVRMLASDLTPKGPAKPEHNLPVDNVIDGQSKIDLPDTMGENVAPEREGIFAQGAGRPIRAIDQDFTLHEPQHGGRTPAGTPEQPLTGGTPLISRRDKTRQPTGRAVAPQPHAISLRHGVPHQPKRYAKWQLLRHGHNTATLAGGNYLGVIMDRLSVLGSTSTTEAERETLTRARFNAAGVVRFDSEQQNLKFLDRAALTWLDSEGNPRRPRRKLQYKFHPGKPHRTKARFEYVRRSLMAGQHQKPSRSKGDDPRSKMLSAVTNLILLNGTYHKTDGDQFGRIIRGRVPESRPVMARPAAAAPARTS